MYIFSEDLYNIIFSFLSLKEKITMLLVEKKYKIYINQIYLTSYKLENRLKRINCMEIKMKNDLMCEYVYNNFKIYKQCKVHSYFRVLKYEKCISNCMREKIGYIYHSEKSYGSDNMRMYNKRYIPYCINCFEKWQIKKKYPYIIYL